jgi:Na+-transporting NADH:ubiquinone oxidoreductase subunit NqrA
MKFIASLLVLSSASAMELATPDVSASSKIGARLLSKARQLENNNKDGDITWISGYSLKFQKCATSKDYYGGYFGGELIVYRVFLCT